MIRYNYTIVKQIAKKYKYRKLFYQDYPSAYTWAQRNKVLPEICKHMKLLKKKNIHNRDNSFKCAARYDSIKQFKKDNLGVYQYLLRKGWLQEATLHIKRKSQPKKMVDILNIIKSYKFWDEFKSSERSLFNYLKSKKIKKQLFIPKYIKEREHPLKWNKQMIFYELGKNDWNIVLLFQRKPAAYQRAVYLGIIDAGEDPVWKKKVWNKKNLLIACKKYRFYGEMLLKEGSSPFNAARRLGIKLPILKVQYCGETYLRVFLEKILEMKLPKQRPSFLKNNKTGKRLELDGYNEMNSIAFEHCGSFHYKKSFRESLKKVQYRDKLKRMLCKRNGIKLIIIKDIIYDFKMDEIKIKNFLEKQFVKNNISYNKDKMIETLVFDKTVTINKKTSQ